MMDSLYIGGLDSNELVSLFLCDVADDDFYDVIAYNINLKNPEYLLNNIDNFSSKRLRGALFGLGFSVQNIKEIVRTLKKYLEQDDPMIVAEVINVFARLRYIDGWKFTEKLLDHESPFVKSAMLKYSLVCLKEEDAINLIVDGLNDHRYIVRESAVDLLGDLGRPELKNYIQPLLNDSNEDVRNAAKTTIEILDNSLG